VILSLKSSLVIIVLSIAYCCGISLPVHVDPFLTWCPVVGAAEHAMLS
jgi:hypothetical protein